MIINTVEGTFEYRFGTDVYTKVLSKDAEAGLYLNGQEIDIETWNQAANEYFPMHLKYESKSPLVKAPEVLRQKLVKYYIHKNAGAAAADIGSGDGPFLNELSNSFEKVLCIDPDSNLLESLKLNFSDRQIDFINASIEKVNLPDDSCDLIIASEILEHVQHLNLAIDEIFRICKRGGRVIVTLPNDLLIINLKKFLIKARLGKLLGGLSPTLAMGHLHIFDRKQIKHLFGEKFKVKSNYLIPPFFLNRIVILECKK